MSNIDYIDKEIEELIITNQKFKIVSDYLGQDKSLISIKQIELMKLLIKFIKYFKGNFIFSNYKNFKNNYIEIKNNLSEEEIEDFENITNIFDNCEEYFSSFISKPIKIIQKNQKDIFQLIIMLEEEQRIKKNIQDF